MQRTMIDNTLIQMQTTEFQMIAENSLAEVCKKYPPLSHTLEIVAHMGHPAPNKMCLHLSIPCAY